MNLNTEEKARSRRDKAKEAIALALESRWEEAPDLEPPDCRGTFQRMWRR